MATGPWRCTLGFQQDASITYGWSVNFWNDNTAIASVKTQLSGLKSVLTPLLGGQAVCKYERIADINVKRAVYSNGLDNIASAVTAINDTDFPTTAVLLYLVASDVEYTHQWLRGVKDVVIKNAGRADFNDGNWNAAITTFSNTLTTGTNNWRIRQMDTTKPEQAISGYNPVTGVMTFKANHPWAVSSLLKVRIKGMTSPRNVNGIHEVSVNAVNQITLSPIPPIYTITTSTFKSAYARELAWSYKPITSVDFERSTSHKTGRPSRQGSGRRTSQPVQ